MKKLFTVFCAVCLMPTFSAQAWVGGPFSNNSFFGENGDDGVYEAAATAANGIGLFRITVGNNFEGVNPTGVNSSVPSQGTATPGVLVTIPGINSGNIVIGAIGTNAMNVWFVAGVYYSGLCLGTANSVMGIVQGFGLTQNPPAPAVGTSFLNSSFTANFQGTGRFMPARAFSGFGTAFVTGVVPAGLVGNNPFNFSVFGSKVSSRILYGL